MTINNGTISERPGMLPAIKITEPYSPSPRAKASEAPVITPGSSAGRTTRKKICHRVMREIGEDRLHGAHDEGQADEDEGDQDAERREGDVDAEAGEDSADPAGIGIERGERNAGNGGRQREGQIDKPVDEAAPGKAIADEHPGDEEADDGV